MRARDTMAMACVLILVVVMVCGGIAAKVVEVRASRESGEVLYGFRWDTLQRLSSIETRIANVEAMYQAWQADSADMLLVPGVLTIPDDDADPRLISVGKQVPIHFRAYYGKVPMPDGSGRPEEEGAE